MRRLVGGPLNGETIESEAHVLVIDGHGEGAYHWTRPLFDYDPDWFIKGQPEPVPPERVYEWHERHWMSPAERYIRDAINEATERVFG